MLTSKFKPVFYSYAAGIQQNIARALAVDASKNENVGIKSNKEVPGPFSLPVIGPLIHFLPKGELYNVSTFELGEILYKKYGPIVRLAGSFGRPDFYLLFDAEASSQVLRSENWLPIRPGFQSLEYYRKLKKPDRATGLITDHGDIWKQFRSTVNPVMLQPKTIKLYGAMLDEVAQDMILRMKSLRGEDNMLKSNFDSEMNLWALESISLVALGRRLNCFDPNLAENSPEKRLIKVVHDIFIAANELDFKPSLWKYYSTKGFKKAMKLYEEHEQLARYFINKTLEELKSKDDKEKTEDKKGILEKLLEINEEVALIMASDMLFGGVDTASNTMTATLYLLANNQEKQDKLREEVLTQSEKRPYLKACLKEALRVMPVVAGNARQTTKSYNLKYHIPKGTHLSFMHQAMSNFEKYYVRPKEYLPERWIVGKEDVLYYGNTHPFAYNPFGFGVRSCIGRRIAELELETFLARIVKNFKVEWFGPPIQSISSSLNYLTGPFNFVFKDIETKGL